MPGCPDRHGPAEGSAIPGPETLDPALRARLAGLVSLSGLSSLPVVVARQVNDSEAAVMFGPVEEVATVHERGIPGPAGDIRIRTYRPTEAGRLPILVYFHGGGWVVGSLDSHDGVARFLANHGRCLVVSVAYRLAPEHRFPAAVEDAWAATHWVNHHPEEIGGDATRLAVGGDSSGGNLAAVVALRARDGGVPLKLQLLVYPLLDCVLPSGISDENAWWVREYLRAESDAMNPDASPLRAPDLKGVASALVLSCGLDPLKEQGEAYVRRLAEAGVAAKNITYPALIHTAYRMPGVLDGAGAMLIDSAAALDRAFKRQT